MMRGTVAALTVTLTAPLTRSSAIADPTLFASATADYTQSSVTSSLQSSDSPHVIDSMTSIGASGADYEGGGFSPGDAICDLDWAVSEESPPSLSMGLHRAGTTRALRQQQTLRCDEVDHPPSQAASVRARRRHEQHIER